MKLAVFIVLIAILGACEGEANPVTPNVTAVPTPDVAATVTAAVATAMAMNTPPPSPLSQPTVATNQVRSDSFLLETGDWLRHHETFGEFGGYMYVSGKGKGLAPIVVGGPSRDKPLP